MPIEQHQLYCYQCNKRTLHQRPGTSHLVHALVSLFMCGLWIPVWIISANSKERFRCQSCGMEFDPNGAVKSAETAQYGQFSGKDQEPSMLKWYLIAIIILISIGIAFLDKK